jgi:hypothetical protein
MNSTAMLDDLEKCMSDHVGSLFSQMDKKQFNGILAKNIALKKQRAAGDGELYFKSMLNNIWYLSAGADLQLNLLTESLQAKKGPSEVDLVKNLNSINEYVKKNTERDSQKLLGNYESCPSLEKKIEQAEFDYQYNSARNSLCQSFLFTCFANKQLSEAMFASDGAAVVLTLSKYLELYSNLLIGNIVLKGN